MSKRSKLYLMISNKRLRQKLECSGLLCSDCPDLSLLDLCNSERCELKYILKKVCNKCCNFGL